MSDLTLRPRIIRAVTLADVRAANAKMIFYGALSCWWTHREEDLKESCRLARCFVPPRDPRGGTLFQTENVEGFLRAAEAQPDHYGKFGLETFMAAHHRNCYLGLRPWCMASWQEYEDALRGEERRNDA